MSIHEYTIKWRWLETVAAILVYHNSKNEIMTAENKANKLYWSSNLYPNRQIELQLTLTTYADNDNLYVGLICPCETVEDGWEPFTDLTINQFSLPPFHAYVDNRDYNKGAHEFLIRHRIAVPNTELPEWNGDPPRRLRSDRHPCSRYIRSPHTAGGTCVPVFQLSVRFSFLFSFGQ